MEIGAWLGLVAVGAVALAAGVFACRWWYGRRIDSLSRQLARSQDGQQTSHRLMSQARKQVEELQRLLAEYRRRHAASESGRRSAARIGLAAPVLTDEAVGAPRRAPPGGWADTQPF